MNQVDKTDRQIEKADRIAKSVERFFITIGVAIFLIFVTYRLSITFGIGDYVLIVGIALVVVLVLVEVLSIERHRHHS